MLIKAKTLEGYKLSAVDGEIGKVKEFYFDDQHWAIRYLVADTGNWLVGRQVLLSPYTLNSVNKDDETIGVNLTKQQIEESPSLETDKPVSKQFEEAYYGYYGFPTYWSGAYMWGAYPNLMRTQHTDVKVTQPVDHSWDPHLRSTDAVSGLYIQAIDGEIGHVEGFIMDDENWAIRYLIIDTKNWWIGKKILVSPEWIEKFSWEESKVYVNMTRESIKASPEYSDDFLVTRDYENSLYQHYLRKGYWMDDAPTTII